MAKRKKHSSYAAIIRAVEYLESTRDGTTAYELRQEQHGIYAAWKEKALYSDCRAWYDEGREKHESTI